MLYAYRQRNVWRGLKVRKDSDFVMSGVRLGHVCHSVVRAGAMPPDLAPRLLSVLSQDEVCTVWYRLATHPEDVFVATRLPTLPAALRSTAVRLLSDLERTPKQLWAYLGEVQPALSQVPESHHRRFLDGVLYWQDVPYDQTGALLRFLTGVCQASQPGHYLPWQWLAASLRAGLLP